MKVTVRYLPSEEDEVEEVSFNADNFGISTTSGRLRFSTQASGVYNMVEYESAQWVSFTVQNDDGA